METGNAEAFTEAVKKALHQPGLFMGREELSHLIHEENSVAKMTKEYMEIYEELMKR